MHRIYEVVALTVVLVVTGLVGTASAQQQRLQQSGQRPPVIIQQQDRWLYGPPSPPSSERNYYGPAPGIQQPMERVPLPAPLAQPPTNR